MNPKILIWASVLLSGVAQILLKKGMSNLQDSCRESRVGLLHFVKAGATETYVWLWGLSFVVATGLWLLGLQGVDLSYAYPLVSFGYVLVAILAALFLGERVDRRRWIAIGVISLGVLLIARS